MGLSTMAELTIGPEPAAPLDMSQRIADARDMAQKGLINLELAEHVHLKGNITDLRFKDVLMNDRISLQLYAEGKTVMELK